MSNGGISTNTVPGSCREGHVSKRMSSVEIFREEAIGYKLFWLWKTFLVSVQSVREYQYDTSSRYVVFI